MPLITMTDLSDRYATLECLAPLAAARDISTEGKEWVQLAQEIVAYEHFAAMPTNDDKLSDNGQAFKLRVVDAENAMKDALRW